MIRPPDDPGPGRRPPDYVIVVAVSDWITDRYPAAAASLDHALQPSQDRHRDPEPDLEAEPMTLTINDTTMTSA